MAKNEKSELASKVEELFKELYDLMVEAKKNGAKVGLVACFTNVEEDGVEGEVMVKGSNLACTHALSEVARRYPEFVKRATAMAFLQRALDIKPSEEEDVAKAKAEAEVKTETENVDKFDKAASEIANIIKGLMED